ncbi:MAG: Tyrosine recombinase XerC [Desulfovibrio sp.]
MVKALSVSKPKSQSQSSEAKDLAGRISCEGLEGVYYRDSTDPKRIFNGKPDRAFIITYRDENGKKRFPTVGWRSEGYSERMAANKRMAILSEVDEKKRLKKLARGGETPAGSLPSATESRSLEQPAANNSGKVIYLSEVQSSPGEAEPELLFSELAERYLTWMQGEGKYADREQNRYDTHIKDIIGWVPYTWIDKLVARDLKADYLRIMSQKYAKDCLSLCRSIFNHARESGYIDVLNPFGRESGFKMPRVQNKCERYLEPKEVDYFFPELKRRHYDTWAMSFLSLRTGVRSTEIFKMKGGDLVPAAGFFWVTAKGGERQKVFCDKEVMDVLLGYKRGRSEYIFQNTKGKRLQEIDDAFKETAEDLGLTPPTMMLVDGKKVKIPRSKEQKEEDQRKKVWFHTMRHTYASWLAQSGRVTLHELRDLMRHTSIEQTERYAHMIPNNSKKEHSGAISEIWNNYRAEEERKTQSEDDFKLQALKTLQDPDFQAALEALGSSAKAQDAELLLTLLKTNMAKAV